MSRVLAGATLLTVVATAYGDRMIASHELWSAGTLPDSGLPYVSYRILVDVPAEPWDDWTAAGMDVTVEGGTFLLVQNDPYSGNPPDPATFVVWPDAEFDSYYTSPGDYPNTTYDGGIVGIASTADTVTRLDTDWFDTVQAVGGPFVIAQITVLPESPDWIATGHLQYAGAHTGGKLWEYRFTIPEPATLTLVALAGLALTRRR
jgi:hypothetical protein